MHAKREPIPPIPPYGAATVSLPRREKGSQNCSQSCGIASRNSLSLHSTIDPIKKLGFTEETLLHRLPTRQDEKHMSLTQSRPAARRLKALALAGSALVTLPQIAAAEEVNV